MRSIDIQPETRDAGRIRLGAAFRLLPTIAPAPAPASPEQAAGTMDAGRIRLGAAFRLIAG